MFDIRLLDDKSTQSVYPVYLKVIEEISGRSGIDEQSFEDNLQTLDYHANLSVGIYDGGVLVGYSLTGYRFEEGRHFAYTITTGVIPEFRKRGLAKMMIEAIYQILKKYDFDAWFLEVGIKEDRTINLFEKLGFKNYRKLYTMSKDNYQAVIEPIELRGSIEVDVNEYWDFTPSWKNTVSKSQTKDVGFSWVYLGNVDQPYAYALFNEDAGVVLQFSVSHQFRQRGYGKELLRLLERANHNKTLSFTNVPQTSYLREFLQDSGYSTVNESIEYILTLKQ